MVSLRTTGEVQEGGRARVPHIEQADLSDTRRLLELFGLCVAAGLIRGSEAERLAFVAAAEHALRKATTNPCGFFAQMLRKWDEYKDHITASDDDAANQRLKAYDYGEITE